MIICFIILFLRNNNLQKHVFRQITSLIILFLFLFFYRVQFLYFKSVGITLLIIERAIYYACRSTFNYNFLLDRGICPSLFLLTLKVHTKRPLRIVFKRFEIDFQRLKASFGI